MMRRVFNFGFAAGACLPTVHLTRDRAAMSLSTISEYAVAAVRAHGAWAGLWLSLRRVSRHPVEALGARHGLTLCLLRFPAQLVCTLKIKAREDSDDDYTDLTRWRDPPI